jgi:O-acetylhomoserine/O-acetylserine sulfhydrylase-like pyridoxal-dependent enzyme
LNLETFKRYGIEIIFVDTLNPDHFEAAINEKTKAIYMETIANSDNTLADIRAMADVCSCLLVISLPKLTCLCRWPTGTKSVSLLTPPSRWEV